MCNKRSVKSRLTISLFLLAIVTAGLIPDNALAGKIYWTEYSDRICRANFDGSNKEVLVTPTIPHGIALDVAGGKMYWNTAYTNQRVMRANLDGSNVETLISTGTDYANYGMDLDVPGGKMWWAGCYGMQIHTANLDGSSHTTPISTSSRAGDVALDLSAGKVYYTVIINGAPEISRANFDGTGQEVLLDSTSGIVNPWGIALDVAGGKMYWTNYGIDKIMRADLDGSNVEDVLTSGLNGPMGIALDVAGGKMYFCNTGASMTGEGYIQRANLDGSGVETLLTGLDYCEFIALDDTPDISLSGWVYMPQDVPDLGYSLNEADLVYFYSFDFVQSFNTTTGGWSVHMPTDWVCFYWPFYYELDTGALWFAYPPESGLWVYHFSTNQWTVLPRIIP